MIYDATKKIVLRDMGESSSVAVLPPLILLPESDVIHPSLPATPTADSPPHEPLAHAATSSLSSSSEAPVVIIGTTVRTPPPPLVSSTCTESTPLTPEPSPVECSFPDRAFPSTHDAAAAVVVVGYDDGDGQNGLRRPTLVDENDVSFGSEGEESPPPHLRVPVEKVLAARDTAGTRETDGEGEAGSGGAEAEVTLGEVLAIFETLDATDGTTTTTRTGERRDEDATEKEAKRAETETLSSPDSRHPVLDSMTSSLSSSSTTTTTSFTHKQTLDAGAPEPSKEQQQQQNHSPRSVDASSVAYSKSSDIEGEDSVQVTLVRVGDGGPVSGLTNRGDLPSAEPSRLPQEVAASIDEGSVAVKSGRRVTFAGGVMGNDDDEDDETANRDKRVISSYLEPPDPWSLSHGCTHDSLKKAYQAACDIHSVKPFSRILEQIQCIGDFTNRQDLLTLKSEKLDGRHIETLEEILRRVQFRSVDLESCSLDDEGLISVCDMMEYYESVEKLNISQNKNIGPRGWQACAKLIRKTPCLEAIDIRGCNVSEQSMPILGRTLRLNTSLSVLHMEACQLTGKALIVLIAALKMNETLSELYLADNRLQATDAIQLGNLLKYNLTLRLLDIRNNHVHDTGLAHITEGLKEQYTLNQGLTTLVLWNNQITYQGMTALSRALMVVKNLETLNLGYNNITNEGVHRLKDGLLKNRSVLRLGMQCTKVTCEGAVALAEVIADSSRLIRLDLRENEIKSGGLMALSLSLKMNFSVTRLDLDVNAKKEQMKDYAVQQKKLFEDVTNYCQRNRDAAVQREDLQLREMMAQKLEEQQQQEQQQQEDEEEEEAVAGESAEDPLEQSIEVGPQSVEIEVSEPSVDVEIEPVPEKVLELENSPDVISAVGTKLTATSTLDSPDIGDENAYSSPPEETLNSSTAVDRKLGKETTIPLGVSQYENLCKNFPKYKNGTKRFTVHNVSAMGLDEVALSSITWPPPAMAAIPPNELPLSLPAQNSLPFHSPVSPLLSPSVSTMMSIGKAASTTNLKAPSNRFRLNRFKVSRVSESCSASSDYSSSSSTESSPSPSPTPSPMLSASQSEKTSLSAVAVSPTTSPPSVTSLSSSQSDSKPVTFTPSASPHTSPVSPTHHREVGPPLPAPASPTLITDSSIDQSTARPTHSVVVDAKKQPQATSSANLSVGEPVSSCDDALISSPKPSTSITDAPPGDPVRADPQSARVVDKPSTSASFALPLSSSPSGASTAPPSISSHEDHPCRSSDNDDYNDHINDENNHYDDADDVGCVLPLVESCQKVFADSFDPPTISISSPSTSSSSSSPTSTADGSPELRRKTLPDSCDRVGIAVSEGKEDDEATNNSWEEDSSTADLFHNHRDSLNLGLGRESAVEVELDGGECDRFVGDAIQISNDEAGVAEEFEKRIATINVYNDVSLDQKFELVTGSPPSTSESIDSDVFDMSTSPLISGEVDQVRAEQKQQQQQQQRQQNLTTVEEKAVLMVGPRGESTFSGLDFPLREEVEKVRRLVEVDTEVHGGGSLQIPRPIADADATSGSSPPSSCDSGVVVVESPPRSAVSVAAGAAESAEGKLVPRLS